MFSLQRIRRHIITSSVGLLIISGCTMRSCSGKKDIAPEEQLHTYVNTAVNVTELSEKEKLIDLTSGDLRRAISAASDEAFTTAYINKRYEFRGFEIVERRDVTPGEQIELDFRLNYKSWSAGEESDLVPFVETLNRAAMVYEHGRWTLASVKSLETSFDWEVGLPLDDVNTAGVSPEDEPKEIDSSREWEEDMDSLPAGDETTSDTETQTDAPAENEDGN